MTAGVEANFPARTEIVELSPSGTLTKRSRRLPACQTILDAIGNLLADGRQVEEFLFAEDICGFFGNLPIHRLLVSKIIIPIHAWHCDKTPPDGSAVRRGSAPSPPNRSGIYLIRIS